MGLISAARAVVGADSLVMGIDSLWALMHSSSALTRARLNVRTSLCLCVRSRLVSSLALWESDDGPHSRFNSEFGIVVYEPQRCNCSERMFCFPCA